MKHWSFMAEVYGQTKSKLNTEYDVRRSWYIIWMSVSCKWQIFSISLPSLALNVVFKWPLAKIGRLQWSVHIFSILIAPPFLPFIFFLFIWRIFCFVYYLWRFDSRIWSILVTWTYNIFSLPQSNAWMVRRK